MCTCVYALQVKTNKEIRRENARASVKRKKDNRARRVTYTLGRNKPAALISSSSTLVARVAARVKYEASAGPSGIRIMKIQRKDGSRSSKKSVYRDVEHGGVSAAS